VRCAVPLKRAPRGKETPVQLTRLLTVHVCKHAVIVFVYLATQTNIGCKELIEKHVGDCNYVQCRCQVRFCFHCGVEYKSSEITEANTHGTAGCDCGLWTYNEDEEEESDDSNDGDDVENGYNQGGPAIAGPVDARLGDLGRPGYVAQVRGPDIDAIPAVVVPGAAVLGDAEQDLAPPAANLVDEARLHHPANSEWQCAEGGEKAIALENSPIVKRAEQANACSRIIDVAQLIADVKARTRTLPNGILRDLRSNRCPYQECGRDFVNARSLAQHIEATNAHEVFVCCGRPFASQHCLDQHRRNSSRVHF
jgi:hypothetical protein